MNKSRRINELARDLEVKSSAILDKLKELGISGKTHSSSVDEDVVVQLRHVFLEKICRRERTLAEIGDNGAAARCRRSGHERGACAGRRPRRPRPVAVRIRTRRCEARAAG